MILDDIVADKRIRLVEHKKRIDLQAMRRLAEEREATGSTSDCLQMTVRLS